MSFARAAAALLLLGATLGPLLDALHTHSGTTRYASPGWLQSAWWCPLLFGGAALSLGLGRPIAFRVFRVADAQPSPRKLGVAIAVFIVTYVLSAFLPIAAKLPTLAILLAVAWWAFDRTALGAGLAVLAGAGGWAVEWTLVRQGLFFHSETELDGIAAWLPFLYAIASIPVGQIGARLASARP